MLTENQFSRSHDNQLNTLSSKLIKVKTASLFETEKAQGTQTKPQKNLDPVQEALKLVVPAWPLQNTVAVNPFWNLRDRNFLEVINTLEPALKQKLLMPISFYQQKYAIGEITHEALSESIESFKKNFENINLSVDDLLANSPYDSGLHRNVSTIAEITPHELDLSDWVISEIGKFCAAYFDRSQALVKFPWQNLSFWEAWKLSLNKDQSISSLGLLLDRSTTESWKNLDPQAFISQALSQLNLTTVKSQFHYLQRASAEVMGWGSQFKYTEWQSGLGYEVFSKGKPAELLAVRIAYDLILHLNFKDLHASRYQQWAIDLEKIAAESEDILSPIIIEYIWHVAFELSYQKMIGHELHEHKVPLTDSKKYQWIFCIDVRSEMMRRHLESVSTDFKTRGFAGFFGTAIDFKGLDEKNVGHRLPVLLKPSIEINENDSNVQNQSSAPLLVRALISSYFRNLRKAPLASFVFVELFGVISITQFISKTLANLISKLKGEKKPLRFQKYSNTTLHKIAKKPHENRLLSTQEKIDFAANSLTHLGMKSDFGRINVIVGHGSNCTNNAFASALDCGACGGHAGDINARFLSEILNDGEIREGLRKKGILLNQNHYFLAAMHETVTDEIIILNEQKVPQEFQADVQKIKLDAEKASKNCRQERLWSRSICLDSDAARRSSNWSEVRPEWGLAGNACFIVAPRERSQKINLSSRSFLHDYNWRNDEDFKTLELIMTAPMVVTNWINLQYFGSVVSPKYFGSGNKVLHNLANESGVFEGNGGDLRVGLPLQSVHDGKNFVHEPLRLSVFIEAPLTEIEKIIAKHDVVKNLVQNEWLYLLQIDPETQKVSRRLPDGAYKMIA